MSVIAAFFLVVFLYSVVSGKLERSVLTAPIVFTATGLLLVFGLPVPSEWEADRKLLLLLAEIGLVLTLFTDATRINLQVLKTGGKLPIRLLSIGMLLTILLGAVAAAVLLPGLSILEACILACILAPTDAGLGEIVVNSPRVPVLIRQALSVEAGLNDGLCVPFLMFFIALADSGAGGGTGRVLTRFVVEQLGFGALTGLAIGLSGGWLLGRASRMGWMEQTLKQLGLVALPLLCAVGSEAVGASMFIAAYVAGLAVQNGFREAGDCGVEFTEGWGRLVDFFVFFLFGMFVARALDRLDIALAAYAVVSLTAVRMIPVALALAGTRLSAATVLFMGWFGPRGLASIVLGLVYLEQESHLPGEPLIRLAVMMAVLVSIFAHGISTLPGTALYGRKIASLDTAAPEHRAAANPASSSRSGSNSGTAG